MHELQKENLAELGKPALREVGMPINSEAKRKILEKINVSLLTHLPTRSGLNQMRERQPTLSSHAKRTTEGSGADSRLRSS
jgi:hypothetical protein